MKFTFDYAVANNRRKLTAVAKANLMTFTDGLSYEVARDVAKEDEGRIGYEKRLVDNKHLHPARLETGAV